MRDGPYIRRLPQVLWPSSIKRYQLECLISAPFRDAFPMLAHHSLRPLPLGRSSFHALRLKDEIYVDKTEALPMRFQDFFSLVPGDSANRS